ncbi:PfkB family carbohydrate kinase [Streptomyces malaysiensis]|uniref:PfkB family carbohydrate kinase n=1 Tax=Streptomyces malaysiensis TaxID=92644 RepID=UPI000BFF2310|nr:PfkB family carbohydrate kinase [Streptomyces malaysiensis]ATL85262.1 putative PfkB family carbohydrate kinase [Streptomyces malaysiensis]
MGRARDAGSAIRTAVVGHVEWTSIARVARVPERGEVVHADVVWEGPAGGGAVAAVQMAALAGGTTFFTALGNDAAARRTEDTLGRLGVRVVAATRTEATRGAVSLVDDTGERTTTTLGPRLQPSLDDALPWSDLAHCDVVHFVAGAPEVLKQARQARVLTATLRELAAVAASGIRVDALAGSAADPAERYDPALLDTAPGLVVRTEGRQGGTYLEASGAAGRYRAAPAPGPEVDSYGMGDTFAAALAHALGRTDLPAQALAAAAGHAARCAATRGPYHLP